jgi:CDP-paratose synthetase
MKLLLSGATGFIGSHLLSALIDEGHQVIALRRLTSKSIIVRKTEKGQLTWLDIDEALEERLSAYQPFDAVVHLATAYFRESAGFLASEKANVEFPLVLLDFSLRGGADLFINTDTFFSREEYKYSYLREYIASKQNFLRWGRVATEMNPGFSFINTRLEHVYGPADADTKFIPALIKDLLDHKAQIPLTSGEQERDFIHVSDVVNAYLTILENKNRFSGFVEVGVGCGVPQSLHSLILEAKSVTRSPSQLLFSAYPQRQGEIMRSSADNSMLKELGWGPTITLTEGISSVVNFFQKRSK